MKWVGLFITIAGALALINDVLSLPFTIRDYGVWSGIRSFGIGFFSILATPINLPLVIILAVVCGLAISIFINYKYFKQRQFLSSSIITKYRVVERDKAKGGKDLYGDAGYLTEDGSWAVDIKKAQGHGIFGPYTKMNAGDYRAIFRMKIDKNQPHPKPIARIDVTRNIGNVSIVEQKVMTSDFNSSNEYQDFALDFSLIENAENVEFRFRTESLNAPECTVNVESVKLKKQ
jgi:hypothetical protein